MDWKLIAVLNIVICVTAHQPRPAKSEQTFIKYFGKEVKVNAENKKSERQEEYVESYPSYEFSYKVSDPHTHDYKGQQEKRHGDKVNGDYWLEQPDGRKRLVKYHANDHIGFNVLIDYSQKSHEGGEAAAVNGNDDSKNENEKRTWHFIHDYKMKKTSKEGGSREQSNGGESNENAMSGQTEGGEQQNSQQNEAQENEMSRSSQEARKGKQRKESGWQKKKHHRQEAKRGNSNEKQNSGQTANSKENSKNEKSAEKIYWIRIPHEYLKKGYEVVEDVKENSEEENNGSNETGGSRESTNKQSAGGSNEENRSNEANNQASGEQKSNQQESNEDGSKEKVYGYKSYVYHIQH